MAKKKNNFFPIALGKQGFRFSEKRGVRLTLNVAQ